MMNHKIKNALIQDNVDIGPLRITGSGAYAIVVYKLTQSSATPNIYTLSVYDNSYPTVLIATITIDTSINGGNGNWNAPLWGWGGNFGMQLRDPISTYFNQPILSNGPLDNSKLNKSFIGNNENIESEVFVSRNSDIILTDTLGNSIGVKDSVVFNTIPNAYPIIFAGPYYELPSGYHIPSGKYSIDISSFNDSLFHFYLFDNNLTYSYCRSDAASNQSDKLYIDKGISVASSDQGTKKIELVTTMLSIEYEKVFQLKDIDLKASDSLQINEDGDNGLVIKNFGTQKSYDLQIKHNSNLFSKSFRRHDVVLTQNSSHFFQPVWDSLDITPLKILIDEDNNGTIDDSLFEQNQTVGFRDEGYLLKPNEFYLSQNFPNPFNPATKIAYQVPHKTFVTLTVYDILGREISTLVKEEMSMGAHVVEFDASHLPSGIYFYTLRATSFVETKKMILLR